MSSPIIYDLNDLARILRITPRTARTYNSRAIMNRRAGNPRPGDFPPPDYSISGSPAWLESTITQWRKGTK